jgi:hypothetical protein
MNRRRVTIATTIIVPFLAGCATIDEPRDETPAPPVEPVPLQSFTQRIEGTAIEVAMIAVRGTPEERGEEGAIKSFYISKTEIPWELYDLFVYPELDSRLRGNDAERIVGDESGHPREGGDPIDAIARPSKPYIPPDRGFGHAGYPAISMTHHAAIEFCKWLSARTGKTYRLPTLAEWRWAAGGRPHEVSRDDHVWHEGNSDWKTHPIASKEAVLGLHDALGNAAEWIADDQDGDGLHEIVGGHYLTPADEITIGWIEEQTPAWNASDPQIPKSKWWLPDAPFVGFRVVCEREVETADERR